MVYTGQSIPQGRFSRVLRQIPRGIEKPVTVAEISRITGISVRSVHSIISELVTRYGVPIGGVRADGRHGVFIATNEAERLAAITPLQSNAAVIQQRVDRLREIKL